MQPAGPVDQAVLNTAEYFVTVRLGTLNPSLIAEYPPPRTAILEDVSAEASPLLRRLDADARTQLFGRREIRVKRPTVVVDEARPRTIADHLGISLHTCRGYIKSLFTKLDAHSQLEAVATARRLGLLDARTAAQG